MKPELDKSLVERYPMLYAQRGWSMKDTCMCWGFEVGDGWYKIIDDLSAKLEAINRKIKGKNKIEATQVKEKFGTLRFYVDYGDEQGDEVERLIREAEILSSVTCEGCGQPGKSRPGGWIKTLCDDCSKRD